MTRKNINKHNNTNLKFLTYYENMEPYNSVHNSNIVCAEQNETTTRLYSSI